ncbi:DUF7315 family membrane protein [Candidatus Halobonum tyrrellensis]|uniref:DUF7315 domain-containing protein n=1 Tax=Candidatus Halobonum tyrrellensis G22 TaxID=1324957 RepID=V4HCJ1_9EURY|nr:hypothetical protein [Candidatus Halobonum tyrrellensis]ESP88405.1 hypothetical protein K933_09787 [Candidatus Halobonum tyrrellensis G22]
MSDDARDRTADADAATADAPPSDRDPAGGGGAGGGREVVVPMRLYKTVTVFSTLIAVVGVVVGFVLLDAATLQVSTLRSVLVALLAAVGFPTPSGVLTGVFAVCGLACILVGAGVYVLGTRFRAEGMGGAGDRAGNGNAQDDDGERSHNG